MKIIRWNAMTKKKWLKKIFYFTVITQKKGSILNYSSINKAKDSVKVSQTFMKQFLKEIL